jgi:tetratricopeptide (TPR) repeat protein
MKTAATLLLTFLTIIACAQSKDRYGRFMDSLMAKGQHEQLIQYLEKELKNSPKDEEILRSLGYVYISINKLDLGEKYYKEAIAVNPKCARCYKNLGVIYGMRSDYLKSNAYLDKAISIDPKDASIYITKAQLEENFGDKLTALLNYDKAIELDPINANYLTERSRYNANQGYFSLAMADLNKAIEIEPSSFKQYFERSSLYYNNNRYQEALTDINKAISLDSMHQSLYIGRGAIYIATKESVKAISDYKKAIQLDPEDFFPYYNLSLAKYELEDMNGSCVNLKDAYRLMLKYDPNNELRQRMEHSLDNYCDSSKASYYYQRGIAFYNLQQYEKAIIIYNVGVKKFPSNAMLLNFRANAHYAAKDYANALTDYYASIKYKDNLITDVETNRPHTQLKDSVEMYIKGFLAFTYRSVAECHFALGQHDLALTAINAGIEIAPKIEEDKIENYYNVRGNIYLALEIYRDALDDFNKCIQLNPGFALAYVNRAITKLNLASKVKLKTISINGGSNQLFNVNWALPLKTSFKKSDENISSALRDCDKAIEIEPKLAFGYAIRGQIKKLLSHGDFCMDIITARNLEFPIEPELLKICGQ